MAQLKLLKPLDGHSIGEVIEYDDIDAKRLESQGAGEIVKAVKKEIAPESKMKPAVENKDVVVEAKNK